MRFSNRSTPLTTPVLGALVASLVLTGAWALLRHQVATPRGLNRSIYTTLGSAGQPLREEATPSIDLDFLEREVDLPPVFDVRWDGYWLALDEQRVTLQARADSLVSVYLDGDLVLRHEAAVSLTPASAEVTLTFGAHQVVVDYEHRGGNPAVSVLWTPEDAQPRPLPLNRLFTRKLDRKNFYETRAVRWLGWIAFCVWLTLPFVAMASVGRRRLGDLSTRRAGELMWRIRMLVFPALLGPLQILLFGTHTIYIGNVSEFSAPFWQLSFHWWPAFVGLMGGLIGFGLLVSHRWFRRYVVALFSFGVLTWLQGGVLLGNYGAFDGQAVDWSRHAWRGPYEIGLWVLGLIGMVAAARRLFSIAPFASQLLIALQAVVLVGSVVRAGPDASATYADQPDFVFELSRTRNVMHIVLDGFQSDVFHEIIENDRSLRDQSLSGFIFFADHAGAFPTTIASIPAMLTGEVYRNQEPIRPFIQPHPARRSLFEAVRAHGFDTDAVSIQRPGLESASNMYVIPRPYVGRQDYTRFAGWQLVDLSLFRHAPHPLKRWIYNGQLWRLQVSLGQRGYGASSRRRYHPDNGRAFLDDFIRQVRVNRDRPVYKFIHLGIPHLPVVLDARCQFRGVSRSTRDRYLGQATCAVNLVTRLLDRLRTLGVYDDSVIVLSSDHGVYMAPRDFVDDRPALFGNLPAMAGSARALLAVKTAHATGPLRISYAPTAITDIPTTVMDMLGITGAGFPGSSALGLDENDARERAYAWYPWGDADWNREHIRKMDLFAINGRIGDRRSWAYRGAIFEPGTDREDMSEGWDEPVTDESGRRVRQVREHAVFYAPPQARSVALEIRSTEPLPPTMTVTVLVNGEMADRVIFDDQRWRTIEYALPVSTDSAAVRIDLHVDPPARLRRTQGRSLGVVTGDVQWR